MKTYTADELKSILALHLKWLLGDLNDGVRADLSRADLSRANLRGANLSWADLCGADLSGASVSGANLGGANLSGANLIRANLRGANLSWANLSEANLSEANLSWSDLSEANLSAANLSEGVDIISVSGIGSARRMTTYWAQEDKVWCGCFTGTLAMFAAKVEETHACHPKHLANYRAAIALFKAAKE